MLKTVLMSTVALIAMGASATVSFAEDINEFRIGILGGENEADRLRNYQCLADHLKETFGFEKVSLFPAADYDGVIQGLIGGTLDIDGLGASGYAKIFLADEKAVTPLLTTKGIDGSTGYFSIGLAKKDSGSKTLADLKGKRISVGAAKSGTELNARAIFKAAGMSYADLAKVEYLPFGESVELIKNRQLDATLQSAGLGVASIRDLATAVKCRRHLPCVRTTATALSGPARRLRWRALLPRVS